MKPSLITYLIVCPLVFLAGFVDSVAGGGGIISLPAYLLAGVPVHFAAGTNKVANGFGTALASYQYVKSGNIEWLCAIPAAIFSLIGAFLSTRLAVGLNADTLQAIILCSLPVVAVILLFAKDFGKEDKPSKGRFRTLTLAGMIGFVIGCYDGLVGPGTGTFLTLGFSLILGYSLLRASGCARIANLASNAASMVVYALNGNVMLQLAIPAMVCSMAGNYVGSHFAIRGGSSRIRMVMFVVLGLLFLKLGLRLSGIDI